MPLTSMMKGHYDKVWFINNDNNLSFNFIEIENKIRNGEITSDTMVFNSSNRASHNKKWLKAGEYKELRELLVTAAVPDIILSEE